MKKLFIFIIWFFNLISVAKGQNITIHKKINIGPYIIYNEALKRTTDNGLLMAGYEETNPSGWFLVLTKFDSVGNNMWCKKYDYNTYERYPQIYQTDWNDYLVSTSTPNYYGIVRCMDTVGNGKWKGLITFVNGGNIRTCTFNNGTIFIMGYHPLFLFKTDSAGNLIWKKGFHESQNNSIKFDEIVKLNQNNMLLAGSSPAFLNSIIVKIDTTGTVLWSKIITVQDSVNLGLISIKLFKTRNSIFGSGITTHGVAIFQIDTLGNILWTKKISSNYGFNINDVSQMENGDILFTGNASDSVSQYNASIIGRLDSTGNIISGFIIGSDSVEHHDHSSIVSLNSGKYSFATFERIKPVNSLFYSYLAILDTNINGYNSCNTRPLILYDSSKTIISTSIIIDTITITQPAYVNNPMNTTIDLITDSILCIATTSIFAIPSIASHFQIFPNPSSGIFQISFPSSSNQKINYTLEVFNTFAQKVFSAQPETLNPKPETRLDLSFLPKGIYFLKITVGENAMSKKLIIQ